MLSISAILLSKQDLVSLKKSAALGQLMVVKQTNKQKTFTDALPVLFAESAVLYELAALLKSDA